MPPCAFYAAAAAPGAVVTVSMRARTVSVGGEAFPFKMSLFEERLLAGGGILPLYKKYGNRLFRVAVEASDEGLDAAAEIKQARLVHRSEPALPFACACTAQLSSRLAGP